ncbi:MAG TPA: hypothetical protein VGK17_17190 [Propionicimonas sp.]|jgi:hypothetical protein
MTRTRLANPRDADTDPPLSSPSPTSDPIDRLLLERWLEHLASDVGSTFPWSDFVGAETMTATAWASLAWWAVGRPDPLGAFQQNKIKQLVAALRGVGELSFPPNLAALDDLWLDQLAEVALEGINLYAAPRSAIVAEILAAPSARARRQLLGQRFSLILDDCQGVLDTCPFPATRAAVAFTSKAIRAARDGHTEASQALAAVTLDTLIGTVVDQSHRPNLRAQRASSREKLDSLEVRRFMVTAPIWKTHSHYDAAAGDPVPQTFSRHATVHGVSARQFSKRNTAQALLAVTGLIAFENGM